MKREVQGVLLILVGGAIMRICLGGAYLNYVKAGMQPYLIAAAVVLLVLGVMALVDSIRRVGSAATATSAPGHDHDTALNSGSEHAALSQLAVDVSDDGHRHGSMRTAWLLLLPVAAIFLVAPPPLGAYSAARQEASVAQPAASSIFDPLPPGDPVPVALDDYATRAVWGGEKTLVGRNVQLVGFVTPTGGGGWVLTRLSLTCCAADAVATKVQPRGVAVTPLPANTWVQVAGSYVPGGGTERADAVPWVQVASITVIPQPKNPYL